MQAFKDDMISTAVGVYDAGKSNRADLLVAGSVEIKSSDPESHSRQRCKRGRLV